MFKKLVVIVSAILLMPLAAYAVRTTITYTQVNVTTSDAQVLASNISRNFLSLYNDSNLIIYCKFGATAAVAAGFGIPASTTSVWENKVPTAALRCIHGGTGNKSILISEGTGP